MFSVVKLMATTFVCTLALASCKKESQSNHENATSSPILSSQRNSEAGNFLSFSNLQDFLALWIKLKASINLLWRHGKSQRVFCLCEVFSKISLRQRWNYLID